MAAARRDDDGTTTKENDNMAAARCYEERTETKTERGMEFPFVGQVIPRNKMMIGVERNKETGTQGNNRQGSSSRQTQPWQERVTLRNARRKTDGLIQGTTKQTGAERPTTRDSRCVGIGDKQMVENNPSLA